jgi:hypothetical protein
MGAVAWGALGLAAVLAGVAVALAVWRRRRMAATRAGTDVVDVSAAEAAARADDREFDRIIGHLLRTDPSFADSAARLSRRDDSGPAIS